MKIKVIKAHKPGWWYNDYIGYEFEVVDFSYYKSGRNIKLNINNDYEYREAEKLHGDINIHVDAPVIKYSGGAQIFPEHTDLYLRYQRIEKLKQLGCLTS